MSYIVCVPLYSHHSVVSDRIRYPRYARLLQDYLIQRLNRTANLVMTLIKENFQVVISM